MSISEKADFFLNFQQFGDMKRLAREGSTEAANTVAQQFEGLLVQQMLAAMRSASKLDPSQHSSYMDTYLDMYDKQLAQTIAAQDRLGLAKLLFKQMPSRLVEPLVANLDLTLPVSANPVTTPEVTSPVSVSPLRTQVAATPVPASPLPAGAPVAVTMPQLRPPTVGVAADAQLPSATGRVVVSKVVDDDFAEIGRLEQSRHRWQNPSQFVADIWPEAKVAATELGINPRLLVAQAALETGWGKHMMKFDDGRSSHNLFGIKADAQWQGNALPRASLEFQEGILQSQVSRFRAYSSPAQSLDDYVDFIRSNPRYQQALAQAGDDQAYIRGIHKAGYATDPNYADKVIGILNGEILRESLAVLDTGVNQHA